MQKYKQTMNGYKDYMIPLKVIGVDMANRQRNNITRLPPEIRCRICKLILQGKWYNEIRNDEIVSQVLISQCLKLHSTTFIAYKKSEEYQKYFNDHFKED